MEFVDFFGRIKNVKNLRLLSEKISDKYDLGDLISYKHIEVGYEDFNMFIETSKGKYFAKILNKLRTSDDIDRLVKILNMSSDNGIRTPKIYKIDNSSVIDINICHKKLKMILLEYVDGINMLFLDRDFYCDEIKQVAGQMAKINSVNYDVNEYYDEWTVTNFNEEYLKKIDKLDIDSKNIINKVYDRVKTIDYDLFPKVYVHADILKSNLILDKNNKVWVIDFSVLNYLPRIVEIAVAIFGICIADTRSVFINNVNILLNEYNMKSKLEKNEIDNLCLVFNAVCAMNFLQASYLKNIGEDFSENDYWINQGKKGILLNLSREDIML